MRYAVVGIGADTIVLKRCAEVQFLADQELASLPSIKRTEGL